jgi:fatty-acyl-CoA synthase
VAEAVASQPVLEHVACGVPFRDHEVAVVDPERRGPAGEALFLPEGTEGELVHRGPSVTAGYYNAPQATADAYRDGWLHTGDLGFVLDGQVYITGRLKDLIIVNGRNVHPQAVEWVVQDVEGIRKGNVVAFSVPGESGEELVVALESRRQDFEDLTAQVREVVQRELSLSVADVAVLPPGALPKTSSGKLQRRRTRQHYMDARLGREGSRAHGSQPDALTLARHVARSVWTRARSRLF